MIFSQIDIDYCDRFVRLQNNSDFDLWVYHAPVDGRKKLKPITIIQARSFVLYDYGSDDFNFDIDKIIFQFSLPKHPVKR